MLKDDGAQGAQSLAFGGGHLSRGRCGSSAEFWLFCGAGQGIEKGAHGLEIGLRCGLLGLRQGRDGNCSGGGDDEL